MVSPGNHNELNLPGAVQQRILAQFQGGWVKQLNVEQMFTLISGVLPLEACLYYQVLPLFLDGNRLYLGMVTPNDTSALEYVRRIVSYLNYSLVPRAITYDALQVALTGYLNYTGNQQTGAAKSREMFSYGHYRHSAQSKVDQVDQSARPTLILDDPEELIDEFESTRMPAPVSPPPKIPASPAPLPPPGDPIADGAKTVGNEAVVKDRTPEATPQKTATPEYTPFTPETLPSPVLPTLIDAVPQLDIQANHLSSPVDVLATLSAQEMLHELLARVLVGGIGRLYFECHPQYGRVLWSQDGVLQSVVDKLPLAVFSQLLMELKRVAELPLTPFTKPQNAEIERLYDRNRVLLRFRFMPNQYGEEATLQVLRGAALRFYQRQQLTKLKRDALGIAKQLQTKLNEIRDRAYAEPGLAAARFEALPALNELLHNLEEQIDHLGDTNTESDG